MNALPSNLDPDERRLAQELREMDPVEPSGGLKERIRAAARDEGLEPGLPAGKIVQLGTFLRQNWFGTAAASIALMFGVLLLVEQGANQAAQGRSVVDAGSSEPVPVASEEMVVRDSGEAPKLDENFFATGEEILVGQRNLGVIEAEDGTAMWEIQFDTMRRTIAQDPESGAPKEQFIPETRSLYVPVRHD